MTVNDAILKSLEQFSEPKRASEIAYFITSNEYCKPQKGKTAFRQTVSSACTRFIEKDTRVKRIEIKTNRFAYYLAKKEQSINMFHFEQSQNVTTKKNLKNSNEECTKSYVEKDLHILLSSYLKSKDEDNTFTKTISHEISTKDSKNNTWLYPDMIGIRLPKLKSQISQRLFDTVNKIGTLELSSYEIKRELNNDTEFKNAFFQAVSNSSWANYGYLVAYEINHSKLTDEMERLNKSFGIGIIELMPNPFESKIIHHAKYKELDFKTIDKLCINNPDFERFIDLILGLMTNAVKDYNYSSFLRDLDRFCDKFFPSNIQEIYIQDYCKKNNIPNEKKYRT